MSTEIRCLNIGAVILKWSPILQGSPYSHYRVTAESFSLSEDLSQHLSIIFIAFLYLLTKCLCSNSGYKLDAFLLFFFVLFNEIGKIGKHECCYNIHEHLEKMWREMNTCSCSHIRKKVPFQWCSTHQNNPFFGKHHHLDSVVLLARSCILAFKQLTGQ